MQGREIMRATTASTIGLLLVLGTGGMAQEPASTKKAELVRELLVVTDIRGGATKIIDSMLSEMRKQYPRMIEAATDADPDLSAEDRQKIQAELSESNARFSKAFQERLKQRIDLGQLVEDIGTELYDKYYTEDELRDLITFYKTPTGKKTLSVLPQIFAESIQRTSEKIGPTVGQLVNEIMAEEQTRLKKSVKK